MLYDYKCPVCDHTTTVYEPMDQEHLAHECERCGQTACRVWTAPQACVDNTEPHFNYGLGVEVRGKNDIREAKRRHEGETGNTLHELGTDSKWRAKRQKKRYKTPREVL